MYEFIYFNLYIISLRHVIIIFVNITSYLKAFLETWNYIVFSSTINEVKVSARTILLFG